MGRHPSHGAPSFRFNAPEVAEMENILREHAGQVPNRDFLVSLATKFSNSPDRVGKTVVQVKQVWNWFQNRRYALRAKSVKSPGPGNPSAPPTNPQGEAAPVRNVPPVAPQQAPAPAPAQAGNNLVRNASENPPMEFEAKSARDGAWYDVQEFLSDRNFETDDPEVFVRFAGFGQEEDEWVNVNKHVRHRSLPCESTECAIVIPGDLILCFQEGKEQALYFDAHVLDVQRRRHDLRGCRCRFLVRYDHDQSEEIVPLRKICRRPETDYRLQSNSTNEFAAASSSVADSRTLVDPASASSLRVPNPSANPVAFPSHTIVNPLAGAPHPALAPATASTSTSTSAPAPSLIRTPSQHLTSGSAPAPAPVVELAPAQTQASAPTLALAPPQAQAPPPVLAVAPPSQASALAQNPALAPAQAPALASHGAPASALAMTPSLTPISAPTPSSIVVSAPTQSPTPNPTPDPTLTAISAPSPSPVQTFTPTSTTFSTPNPTPIQVHSLVPVRAPEAKNLESDSPASASVGEASIREIIMNPSGASTVMESKKEEISIPVTSTNGTGGSSVFQGETENPAVSPKNVESINAPSEPMNLTTAPIEGGPSMSTMADSINELSVSVDTKEGKAENS